MNHELIRLVESISRDKNIDRELLFQDLELAIVSGIKKKYGQDEEAEAAINRQSGELSATLNGEAIDAREVGRIAAQTAKQVMIQRIREAERGSLYSEFKNREGTIVTGSVTRVDDGAITVNLGRGEGFLPRSEQIPGESHQVGERIRALILEVRETPHQIKVVLSRSHPDFVRRLFELEVPEVAERIIEIKAMAREAGYRTKVAVTSIDSKVDALGACVGVRGSRVNNIVDELGGERVDIVRWNESSQVLIANSLKPAEINQIALCFELDRATVVVNEDQLSLAIGKRGQNVRLAARLTGWDIDILTPAEYNAGLDRMVKTLRAVEGVSDEVLDKMIALGIVSLLDIEEVGAETLIENCGVSEEVAGRILAVSAEEAKKIVLEQHAARERSDAARRVKEAREAEWARKLAAGEMTLEQVEQARTQMAVEELERRAAEVGLGGAPIKLPRAPVAAVPAREGGPLTLEQRLALARQREQERQGAASGAEPEQAAGGETGQEGPSGPSADSSESPEQGESAGQAEPPDSAEQDDEQKQEQPQAAQTAAEKSAESPTDQSA